MNKKIISFIFFIFYLLLHVSIANAHNNDSICPSQDFSKFFSTFSEDINTQIAFTVIPLGVSVLNMSANPEPIKSNIMLNLNEIEFPLLPNKNEQKRLQLDVITEILSSVNVKVSTRIPDSGVRIDYYFTKSDCWRLYFIDDRST